MVSLSASTHNRMVSVWSSLPNSMLYKPRRCPSRLKTIWITCVWPKFSLEKRASLSALAAVIGAKLLIISSVVGDVGVGDGVAAAQIFELDDPPVKTRANTRASQIAVEIRITQNMLDLSFGMPDIEI